MIIYALITALVAVVAAVATWKIRSFLLRALIVAALAYGTAYSLYWSEVWLGATDDQFSTWAPLVIYGSFAVGLVCGGFALVITAVLRHKSEAKRS
jgi:hypothetical protein